MRQFLKEFRFAVVDGWRSRGGRVEQRGRTSFYRDASDVFGRGLGGADVAKIREHTEQGLRPDGDD